MRGLSFRLLQRISTRGMASTSTLEAFFAPPASVRGMRSLDKDAFHREVDLPGIRLREPALCAKFLQRLKHVILKYPGVKKVVDVGGNGGKAKVLLLTPEWAQSLPLSREDVDWIEANGGERITHTVALDYQHYSMQAILHAALPPAVREVPSAFEVVGHIAHLNLKENVLPYKEMVGQVLLSKFSNIRTVVNKTDSIDETFRFFKMEVLAGEDDMEATVKENGCTFSFDFSKVYWNSRLHTEHERVTQELEAGEVVLDVFAGVGPFALPACKKGCLVYANDLNPHAYSALCANAKQNHVQDRLKAYNVDGREFIAFATQELLDKALKNLREGSQDTKPVTVYSHIIMNLPALAVEFLDAFQRLFVAVPSHLRHLIDLPKVHCYCFTKSPNPSEDALRMVEEKLGVALREDACSVFSVRAVAPSKQMMRVSFRLPNEVAYGRLELQHQKIPSATEETGRGTIVDGDCVGPPSKRSRLD